MSPYLWSNQDAPWLAGISDWIVHLAAEPTAREEVRLGDFSQTGYPLGPSALVEALERKSAIRLRPGKPGRPRLNAEKTSVRVSVFHPFFRG